MSVKSQCPGQRKLLKKTQIFEFDSAQFSNTFLMLLLCFLRFIVLFCCYRLDSGETGAAFCFKSACPCTRSIFCLFQADYVSNSLNFEVQHRDLYYKTEIILCFVAGSSNYGPVVAFLTTLATETAGLRQNTSVSRCRL